MHYTHQPVLLEEVIKYLRPKADQNFIDCTLGGGGHAIEILKYNAPKGRVLGIDLNPPELENKRLVIAKDNFKNLIKIIEENNFKNVSGILFDLGVSSMQLDSISQGFGFTAESLDMRMDKNQELTAEEIVNSWSTDQLIKIFKDFGEERLAVPIAKKIESERKKERILKPKQLVKIIEKIYHQYYKKPSRKNPATKVFQALRIAVNNELKNLEIALPQAINAIKKGGRVAVISFHSLEDRIVKKFFKTESRDCVCPPEFPICQCSHKKTIKIITKKPITTLKTKIKTNPRARSAKLRVAEKL